MIKERAQYNIYHVSADKFNLLNLQYPLGEYDKSIEGNTQWFKLEVEDTILTIIWFKEDE